LLDISATGLKLIAPESLAVDEILSIEAEDHLALADTRYSQARGDKFTIGCERIHLLTKASPPDEKSKADQIKLLLDDYRSRIRTAIATERPDANQVAATTRLEPIPEPGVGPVGPFSTREQLLDTAAAWVVEHWDKVPASPRDATASRSEIVDRLTVHLAEKLRPPMPPQSENPSEKKPQRVSKRIQARRWRIPIGLAAAAIVGWGLSAVFWSFGSKGAANHLQTSIASLISPKEPAPVTPTPSVRHAMIKVVEATWVMATSDGKRLFNKKLAKDDIREIEFSNKALLRIGNAKGVEISLDGSPIGPIGGRGQIRLVELSATGFRLLPLTAPPHF
jgi:hypothetical protein